MSVPKRKKLFLALGAAVGLAGCGAFSSGDAADADDGGQEQTPGARHESTSAMPVETSQQTAPSNGRSTATSTPRPGDHTAPTPANGTPTPTVTPTPEPTPVNETTATSGSLDGGVISGSSGTSGSAGGSVGGHAPTTGGSAGGTDETASTATPTPTADDGELDRREANVLAVEATKLYDGRHMFEVTLSQDASEGGFADWWQVETRDGKRLGRRSFGYPFQGEQSFSSLGRIAVPADEKCVVVRGHEETHGYGGQAMVITLATGETTAVRQGSSKESLAGVACPGAE